MLYGNGYGRYILWSNKSEVPGFGFNNDYQGTERARAILAGLKNTWNWSIKN